MAPTALRHAAVSLATLVTGALLPPCSLAQVAADRGASILVFPKVIADASVDTVIQLVNLLDNNVDAYCAYVDGSSGTWRSLDFRIALGPRGPLSWTAARGRPAEPGEPTDIPAAPAPFRGSLLCVQVDGTGAPFSGNELAGRATLSDLTSGDVAAYSAVGLRGSGLNDGDEFLCIGDEPSDTCFIGEYDPCPAEWILSLPAEGAADTQLSSGSRLSTHLTITPCSQNLRDATPGTVDIELTVFNELEERFSGTVSVTCWSDLALAEVGGQIFSRGVLGTDYAEARLRATGGSGGFILVASTTRATGDAFLVASSVAVTPHHRGAVEAPDLIVLPAGSLR